jgi:hypothetical protein
MWFTETAWPPIIILAIGAAVLLSLWSTSRRVFHLLGAILLLICCGVVYVVEQQIVTERERVEEAIYGVADAFEAADTGATLKFISPRALDLQLAVQFVMSVLQVRVEDELRITDVSIEMLNEDTRARAHFRANGTFFVAQYGDVGHRPTRWNVTWQKEGGEWKIINVERLDPVRGDPMPLLPISE